MSEFLLEIFSEEIPPALQISARENLLRNVINFLDKENIIYDKNFFAHSTPNRLVIYFKNIQKEIVIKSREIRGPKVSAPKNAIEGFIKSNEISKKKLYKRVTESGSFFFYRTSQKKVNTQKILEQNMPNILAQIKWKKSMRWGTYDLYWGRPLKSIMAIFNGKTLNFRFFHVKSSNKTYIDKNLEQKQKVFKNFKNYKNFFNKTGIIIDQNYRRSYIEKNIKKFSLKKNLNPILKDSLIEEVTNIVEKPNIILCTFNKKYLDMPDEIIVSTIENHQKFFLVYDKNNHLINHFFIVADCEDKKGLIKKGNERVIEARLSDADYFWKLNKSKNMIKQVFKLQKINYFNGLGNYFDKVQRLKKIGGILSDELLISKEKVEIASTICKVDLLSDLVSEFPELQGIVGGYFAEAQGFEKEVSNAVREHYLPTGNNSKVPKKSYSVALSVSDRVDTLVGFFGLNLIPTSSKDPYALRRVANGLTKIIIENKFTFKLKELINYSCQIYNQQSINFDNIKVITNLTEFMLDRFKYFMKEKGIRKDIIETAVINFDLDEMLTIFSKANKLNGVINKQIGLDLIINYKRAANILNSQINEFKDDTLGYADPSLFKNEYEKDLYKKIHDIRKNFTNIKIENDYEEQLSLLASAKNEITSFFENVVVNDEDEKIKKNRIELLKMLCKTYDNYFNLTKIDSLI